MVIGYSSYRRNNHSEARVKYILLQDDMIK